MKILSHTQNITIDVTGLPNANIGGITADQVEIVYYRTGGRWRAHTPAKVYGKNKIGDVDLVWVTGDWPEWLRDIAIWCLPRDNAL